MPVVECVCGMVMSVASSGRRTSCIRCGIQLHIPNPAAERNETNQGLKAALRSLPCPPSPDGTKLLLPAFVLPAAVSESSA